MTAPEIAGRKPPLFDRAALRLFMGYYRRRVARLLVFTAGAALQSMLVLPVLVLIQYAFDQAIPGADVASLVRVGAAIILIRITGTLLSLALRSQVLHTIKGAVTELRRDLVSRLYRLSHRYYASADLALLHTRIVQDSERVDLLSNTLFSGVVPALAASLVLFVVLVVLSWKLVLVGAVLLPFIWLSSRASGWVVRRDVFTFQRAFEGFSKGVNFAVRQLDLTRVKAFEHEELERQGQHIGELYASGHRMAMSYAVHSQVQRTLTGIGAILILVIGGAAVARGRMTLGEFLTFYVAAGMFYGYLDTLTTSIPELLAGNASLVTLQRFLTDGEPEPYTGERQIAFDGSVEMRAVTFGYGDAPVLRRIDLAIPRGAQVAIVGPNGAGKSTLVHLLLGFYRPNGGQVLASGVPLDQLDLRSLRRSIGVVPQRPQFFSASVRENITYGSPDATPEEIEAAARLSLADEVIARLPEGYETMIGDHGVRLSGGEAQRLAIARALLGRPRLLILDEPTNHLDVPAVGRLMSGLAGRDDRPTLIVISHDRSVVEFAAQVYQLESGTLHADPQALVNAAAI
jgi:ABC-type multidrug transport system fused ATPase/permease subunit